MTGLSNLSTPPICTSDDLVRATYLQMEERIASLEADCQAYREVAQAAIHTLHKVTTERDAARRSLYAIRRSLSAGPIVSTPARTYTSNHGIEPRAAVQ